MAGFLQHSTRRMQKLLFDAGRSDAELTAWHETITRDGFWDLGLTSVAAWGRRPEPIAG